MIRVVFIAACLSLTGCGWGISAGSSEDRRSPLEKAAESGDAAAVKRLLANDASASSRALFSAVLRDNNTEIIRMLIAAGANPNGDSGPGRWNCGPLSVAASYGHLENIRALLDAGASLQQPHCPLIAGWLKPPVVDLLVQRGLDLQALDEKGRNALHIALAPPMIPRFESVEHLIRAGVPINARDKSGKTPLAYWREPRNFEVHWLREWLLSYLFDDYPTNHTDRARISALLERAGAAL